MTPINQNSHTRRPGVLLSNVFLYHPAPSFRWFHMRIDKLEYCGSNAPRELYRQRAQCVIGPSDTRRKDCIQQKPITENTRFPGGDPFTIPLTA